jgi:hypothetical protein
LCVCWFVWFVWFVCFFFVCSSFFFALVYRALFDVQVKTKLLQKMTSCSIQHAEEASYYVSVNGVRVLDDTNIISQVATQDVCEAA